MSSITPVLLILGAGKNIGSHVASAFKNKGYQIATVTRSTPPSGPSDLHIFSDLSDPKLDVPGLFAKVSSQLGSSPSVVVYNASYLKAVPKDDPLSLPLADLEATLQVQVKSLFAAAAEAKNGFATLPDSAARTFIYTGNKLNTIVMPSLVSLGVGKAAGAHVIGAAAEGYKDKGYKFYYADERVESGDPVYGDISGPAAADFYLQLAERKEQGPWLATFVNGLGYKDFGPYKL